MYTEKSSHASFYATRNHCITSIYFIKSCGRTEMHSSEADLWAESEILDGGAVLCDAAGVTFLGSDSRGVRGLPPPENFEKLK